MPYERAAILPTEPRKAFTPPIISNNHLQGWWAKPDSFIQRFEEHPFFWQVLNKKRWLATQAFDKNRPHYTTSELVDIFLNEFKDSPICVAGFDSNNTRQQTHEIERGFLVPKDWANQLNIIDNTTS